ncbi:NucA/NucB deoxyribonuclease domain-containing protein [Streptomyces sp. IPPR8]|uniref:NucA/NucB deoxyribonuclease domain-containing protein n=1 Tax=unclassified Streptomyces TaxID=2593676 RepID=UPI00163C40F1|nr:hypothetical protein [Streptomyces sp. WAC06128]
MSEIDRGPLTKTLGGTLRLDSVFSRTRPKARLLIGAVAAALLMSQMSGTPVHAEEGTADLEMVSSVAPVGADMPSLEQVRQRFDSGRQLIQPSHLGDDAVAAMETVGPAASYAPKSPDPSGTAPAPRALSTTTAAAGLYPEPAHTMTAAECEKGLGRDKKFFIKSRFAVCSGAQFMQTWVRNGTSVGQSSFVLLAIGTVAKGSRTMEVQYRYTHLDQTGVTGVSGLMITPSVVVPQKWPATAQTHQGGLIPGAQSWAALKAQPTPGFLHTLTVNKGQGSKPDDTVFAVYQPSVSLKPTGGWRMTGALSGTLFFLAPRWDSARYISSSGGAVFSYVVAMPFSTKAGAKERLAAQHIKDAYTAPKTTKPVNNAKNLPGLTADRPLTRLYHDAQRRKDNRNEAIKTCKKYWGNNYASGGKECDEFPFATTYQGAAQALKKYDPQQKASKDNFSARPIPKEDNGAGGRLMADFYRLNRIIDGSDDGFLIKIT